MIIGTAGHIDHGKTSLIKAITGVDADRLKEEKARGITIELGFAYWPQPDGTTIGFVDVPGHERFVSTMMAGAQGVDALMLVVAADDGVMPQTREHLEIVSLLGPRKGVVALTKADRASAERIIEVENQIAQLLHSSPLEGSAIFPVSAQTGQGMAALKAALQTLHATHAPRTNERLFRLAVDRAFVLHGTGVVVTGTVLDGTVKVGDEVIVSPKGVSARVRALHAQNQPAESGRAGDRCALNLVGPGITRDSVAHGDMVLSPLAHAPCQRIDAEVLVAPGAAKGLGPWMPARLHHGTVEVGVHLVPLEDAPLQPGMRGRVQLVLERPIAAFAQDRFVLRDPSAAFTLAGGRFLDLRAPERKRRTPERRAMLDALAAPTPEAALTALLEASSGPVDLSAFAQDHGEPEAEVLGVAQVAQAHVFAQGSTRLAISQPRLSEAAEALRLALETFHAANPDLGGMGLERLRLGVAPRLPAPLFRMLLRLFVTQGWLAQDGNWIRLASHSVTLSLEDENLLYEIRPQLSATERFRPPRVRDIAHHLNEDEAVIRHLLRRCARAGELDEVAQDHFFLRSAVIEGVEIAAALELACEDWFNAASFRDAVEAASGATVGRKVAIQFLEFLDRHGVTIRRGDKRRVNPHRRMLFALQPEEPAQESRAPAYEHPATMPEQGRESSPVGRPDFKSGWGREPVPGGFDSHSLPPASSPPPSLLPSSPSPSLLPSSPSPSLPQPSLPPSSSAPASGVQRHAR